MDLLQILHTPVQGLCTDFHQVTVCDMQIYSLQGVPKIASKILTCLENKTSYSNSYSNAYSTHWRTPPIDLKFGIHIDPNQPHLVDKYQIMTFRNSSSRGSQTSKISPSHVLTYQQSSSDNNHRDSSDPAEIQHERVQGNCAGFQQVTFYDIQKYLFQRL